MKKNMTKALISVLLFSTVALSAKRARYLQPSEDYFRRIQARMEAMESRMDQLFRALSSELDPFTADFFRTPLGMVTPPLFKVRPFRGITQRQVTMTSDEDAITISVDLPGFEKDNIKVLVDDRYRTISIEAHQKKEHQEEKQIKKGDAYTKKYQLAQDAFSWSYYLGEEFQYDKIKSEFKNGRLIVTVPRDKAMQEKSFVREVEISTED